MSTLVCYLFPGAMVALEEKLKQNVLKNITIVSNTLALLLYKPTKVIKLKEFYQTPIYVYHWQPK
ncbi:hypothetical protein [Pseudoalteromonas sp. S1612]|nr:hypothetical protein [Pseudoalteromonas sp. S1612]